MLSRATRSDGQRPVFLNNRVSPSDDKSGADAISFSAFIEKAYQVVQRFLQKVSTKHLTYSSIKTQESAALFTILLTARQSRNCSR